jgi:hypothetical protein
MYYGKNFDIKYFQGKFELAAVEGTVDDRGCNYVFMKTASQIRTSQLHSAINEYNLCVPANMVMRLQEEIYQPAIVTMSSRRMEGSIYSKIIQDKQTKCNGGRSNYWFWDPELEELESVEESELGDVDAPSNEGGSGTSSSGVTSRIPGSSSHGKNRATEEVHSFTGLKKQV